MIQSVKQNSSIEAFFILIRAGLFGRIEGAGGLLPDHVDWAEVYQLALEQRVIGLVTEGMEILQHECSAPLVPQAWTVKFVSVTLQMEKLNQTMNRFVAGLVNKLRKNGINSLLLKGQGVAQSYEKPLWRVCGDVDLLLSEKDYQKAKDFLLPFVSCSDPEDKFKKHVGMTIGGWLVELHGSLRCGFSSRIDRELDKVYEDTMLGGKWRSWMNRKVEVFMMREENDVLYVFTHFLNHFFKGGIGVRQISDWSRLLWSFRDSLDLQYIESRLRDMGLMSEWKAFGMYAVEYLGMPEHAMPLFDDSDKWKQKAQLIHEFIIKSGSVGYQRMKMKMEKNGEKESFLTRKVESSGHRACDLASISRIFPMDTLRFFPSIVENGIRQK